MRQFDVRDAVSAVYRRWGLGLTIVVATLLGVVVGNYVMYPVYESSIKILVERAPGFEIPFSPEQLVFKKTEITQTQCELLRSRPVLEETVRRLHLDQRPLPSGSPRDTIHTWGRQIKQVYCNTKEGLKRLVLTKLLQRSYTPPTSPDPFFEAVDALREHVLAEPVPNTDLVVVVVQDREAPVAEAIADTIGEVYLEHDVVAQRRRARQVYELIDAQVTAFKPSYETAERAVEDFEVTHEARLFQEQIRATVNEISSLELAYSELVEKQRAIALTAQMELARLEQLYDPGHPQVLSARSDLREALRRLEPPTTQEATPAPENEVYASALRAKIAAAEQRLAEFNRLDGLYSRLLAKKEQEEGLFFKLKTKREEAQVAEATRAAGTRVVEPAWAATSPRYPRNWLNLLLGFAGGLLLAGGFCTLLEFMDRSVKTPRDMAEAADVPVICSIPDWRRGRFLGGWR